MKNLFILFLFAFVPVSFLSAQEAATATGVAEGTKCKVSCLLTSCEIECTPTQGAANCGCWFGLAQCTCIDIAKEAEVTQTASQRQALANYQSELNASGKGDLAEILGQIQSRIDSGREIGSLIKAYGNLIETKYPGEADRN